MKKKYAVGLMSGTSLDGIDAALVAIEGVNESTQVELLHYMEIPFTEEERRRIKDVLSLTTSNVKKVCDLNVELGYLLANAVLKVCESANMSTEQLAFIASHGLTAYHNVEDIPHATLQLGEAAIIAYQTNTTVVSNFRAMDIAAGGQGAPLVPFSEFLLYREYGDDLLLLNIGGIANLTKMASRIEDVFAFDTGPGNMIIDAWMQLLYQRPYDDKGSIARRGQVHQPLLEELVQHPYLKQPIPKSTGREAFGQKFAEDLLRRFEHVAKEDLIATVTMFTVLSIIDAIHRFIDPIHQARQLVVGGGGANNDFIIEQLALYLPQMNVSTQDSFGFSSLAKEAIAFAILGNQTIHHEYSNIMNVTGANESVILGQITPAPRKDQHGH